MNGKYLLDSSILIRVLRGDEALLAKVAALPQIFGVPTVIGELFYGARKSEQFLREQASINSLLGSMVMLPYNYETGVEFAIIKDALRRKGRPIPEADMWIAAAAKQYHLTLIHRDRHFGEIDELSAEMW